MVTWALANFERESIFMFLLFFSVFLLFLPVIINRAVVGMRVEIFVAEDDLYEIRVNSVSIIFDKSILGCRPNVHPIILIWSFVHRYSLFSFSYDWKILVAKFLPPISS